MNRLGRPARLAIALFALALGACSHQAARDEPAVDIAAARHDGEAAYAAGDWRTAEPHYRALVKAIPQDAELWFRLGNIYARTDQPDRAVQAYREALVRDGDLGKAWFNMGVVHLREAANSFMKMGVHVSPDHPMARQGADAYAAVMAILGQQEAGDATAAASPAPVPQALPTAVAPPLALPAGEALEAGGPGMPAAAAADEVADDVAVDDADAAAQGATTGAAVPEVSAHAAGADDAP
ncbi:MAG: tetratricopeptide repeat protein [Gammaproteobacteria bacterium]|nr:tetratricopeptide repeat protein [Gammaproteobacteria bacterium]